MELNGPFLVIQMESPGARNVKIHEFTL